jgi:hypothetical protein
MHLAALPLQLVDKVLKFAHLNLKLLDLVRVWTKSFVEGSRQRIRRGLQLEGTGAHGLEGARVLARAESIALVGVDVLWTMRSRIHVFDGFFCGRGGGAEAVVLLQVGLAWGVGDGDGNGVGVGAGVVLALRMRPFEVGVFGVRVCSGTARQTFKKHGEKKQTESGGATLYGS